MIIKVRYIKDIPPLERHGDWIDLCAAEDIIMEKGDYALIPLGVAIELPAEYEAIVAPRSSTFVKYGIISANSIGIIDNAYCGNDDEWKFLAYATRLTKICKGDRIAQFRVQRRMEEIILREVETLDNPNRGGIGSTGR